MAYTKPQQRKKEGDRLAGGRETRSSLSILDFKEDNLHD